MFIWEVVQLDVLEWAANYDGPKFHALLCDPPYELEFMGRQWDGKGISFNSETWAALAEHLLPGAFGMAFGSSRGWHRLAVAIEDAGLRIFPSIFIWANGQSFPKATRIDTQIDKAAGKLDERKIIGHKGGRYNSPGTDIRGGRFIGGKPGTMKHLGDIMEPATNLARIWQGHRYGLQLLKNAAEPIIVFQKPYEGKPVDSITATGAGALNIDEARIGVENLTYKSRGAGGLNQQNKDYGLRPYHEGIPSQREPLNVVQGRWPANFVLQHLNDHDCTRCSGKWPECPDCHGTGTVAGCRRVGTKRVKGITGGEGKTTQSIGGRGTYQGGDNRGFFNYADPDGLEEVVAWDCHPDCPVRKLGEQSGERAGFRGFRPGAERQASRGKGGYHGSFPTPLTSSGQNDKGTAARFFHQSDWSYEIAERLANADPVRYQAKAGRKERDAGLEMREVGHRHTMSGGLCIAEGRTAAKGKASGRNPHPTVKPIALAKWLAILLLPPPEYAPRRILIPFSGTSSEGIGAMLAGWDEIVMIEKEPEYVEIAEARLKYWASQPEQLKLM